MADTVWLGRRRVQDRGGADLLFPDRLQRQSNTHTHTLLRARCFTLARCLTDGDWSQLPKHPKENTLHAHSPRQKTKFHSKYTRDSLALGHVPHCSLPATTIWVPKPHCFESMCCVLPGQTADNLLRFGSLNDTSTQSICTQRYALQTRFYSLQVNSQEPPKARDQDVGAAQRGAAARNAVGTDARLNRR